MKNDDDETRQADELRREQEQREIEAARRREAQLRAENQLREQQEAQLQQNNQGQDVVGRLTHKREQNVQQKVDQYNDVHDDMHNYHDLAMGVENLSRIRDYAHDQHDMMADHNQSIDQIYTPAQREAMTAETLGGTQATTQNVYLTDMQGQQYQLDNNQKTWDMAHQGVDRYVDQFKYSDKAMHQNDQLMNQYNQELLDVGTIMRHPDLDELHDPEKMQQQMRMYQRADLQNNPALQYPTNDDLQQQMQTYFHQSKRPGYAMSVVTDAYKYAADLSSDIQRGSNLDGATKAVSGLQDVTAITDQETARIGQAEKDVADGKAGTMQIGQRAYQIKAPHEDQKADQDYLKLTADGSPYMENGKYATPYRAFEPYMKHQGSYLKEHDLRQAQTKVGMQHVIDAEGNYDYYNENGDFKSGSIHSSRRFDEPYQHWSMDKLNQQNQRDSKMHQQTADRYQQYYEQHFANTAQRKRYEKTHDWVVDDALRQQTGTDRRGGNPFADASRVVHTYSYRDNDPARQMGQVFENGTYWKQSPAQRTQQYRSMKQVHRQYENKRQEQRENYHHGVDVKNGTTMDDLTKINGRKRGLTYLVDKNGNIVDMNASLPDKLKAAFNEAIQDIKMGHQLKKSWVDKKVYDMQNGHSAIDKGLRGIAGGITAAKVLGHHYVQHHQDERDYQSAKDAILNGTFDEQGHYTNGAWDKIMKGRDFRESDVRAQRNGTHLEGVNVKHHKAPKLDHGLGGL